MFPYLKTLLSLLVLCVHLFAAKLLWFAGYCGSAWIWKRRLNHISSVYRYAKASLILTVQLGSTLCMNYPTEVCHLLFSKYTMQCTYITSDSPQGKKLFSWQQGRGAEARKNKVEKLQTNQKILENTQSPHYVVSTLLLFEGKYCKQNAHCFFPQTLRVKFTSLDFFTLCFSEKLPVAGNLVFILEGNDLI